ncbi:MAG: DnaJ domain-containing protein [Saprospiraceae bacterium]|nr:DnaJ domain-containing protein [Saprospiraceae bacterium]
MNYFEFFNLPVRFLIDEDALRKAFYANSKKYHPDFFTLDTEEKQAEILELSTLNNQAYNTLSDFDKRMKYILDLKNVLAEEGQNQLPQDFLGEMMDINEALMELEFDFEQEQFESIQQDLDALEQSIYEAVRPLLEGYEDKPELDAGLVRLKEYYLKKRYLLRIRENLSKFASL